MEQNGAYNIQQSVWHHVVMSPDVIADLCARIKVPNQNHQKTILQRYHESMIEQLVMEYDELC